MVAKTFIIKRGNLDKDESISPENYTRLFDNIKRDVGVPLGNLISLSEENNRNHDVNLTVLDVSHSSNGIINISGTKYTSEVKTQKKIAREGDVIISRLRPYLKQVGFVDRQLLDSCNMPYLATSTEYYVLRSKDTKQSIAFLVPFLLSNYAQKILSDSVQGGHHPRFREEVLLELEIPTEYFERHAEMNEEVLKYISEYRCFEKSRTASLIYANSVTTSALSV